MYVDAPQPLRSRLPRAIAIVAALVLFVEFLVANAAARLLDRLIDSLVDRGDDLTSGTTADVVHPISHGLVSWAGGDSVHQFRVLLWLALLGVFIALTTSFMRRPAARWPEAAWIGAAALALVPELAFQLWVFMWMFPAALLALAAWIHYKRRRGITVAGTVAYAQPHLQAAGRAAAPALNVAREQGGALLNRGRAVVAARLEPAATPPPTPVKPAELDPDA